MAKIGIISFNLIAILLYKIFLGGSVQVVQNMPDEIYASQVFTIDVKINKGDQFGFAKWQQSIPEGFIAEAIDTKGATFSFKNNEVKLIWMALPEEEEFTISYKIKSDPLIEGTFNFDGKFSFIENNERNDILAESHTLIVKPKEEMPDDIALEVENEKEVSIKDGTLEVDEKVTNSKDISINRKINHLGKGNYEVSLTIDKGNFSSFGKVEEYLPPGFKAYPLNNHDGFFSFSNNVMKILWMTLPEDESYTIQYGMESFTEEFDTVAVHGVFSYLDGEASKQVPIKGSWFKNYFTSPEKQLAEETQEAEDEVTEEIEEVEEETEAIIEEVAEQSPTPTEEVEEEKSVEDEITDIPAPETAVSYKVQIAAAKKEVDQQYFIDRHGVREKVNIEFHNTWYKYTIGAFGIYKEARDKRNDVWANDNKINDAFVTAYNSGERISVQEALMITKQKWYK